jgi:hypothetical protein
VLKLDQAPGQKGSADGEHERERNSATISALRSRRAPARDDDRTPACSVSTKPGSTS